MEAADLAREPPSVTGAAVIGFQVAQRTEAFREAGQVAAVGRVEAVHHEDVYVVSALLGANVAGLDRFGSRLFDGVQKAQTTRPRHQAEGQDTKCQQSSAPA